MAKLVLTIVFLLVPAIVGMAYGKVFPTSFPMKTPPETRQFIVKNISELSEFADLISDVDDTRRILELRVGMAKARVNYSPRFTFRCICGTKYASVFGSNKL
jgi:hypothetical protein